MSAQPAAVWPAHDRYDQVAQTSAALVIRHYSTSFGLASRLFTEPVRTHISNVYALVRIADEAVDTPRVLAAPDQHARILASLENETYRAIEDGHSANLIAHAFALTARECEIERELISPFFDSMRMDLTRRVHDHASFQKYVYGSAEVVGLMCLKVFLAGHDRDDSYAKLTPGARRLGAAFQKLNFLRDMAEDHGVLGRTYFPGVEPSTFCDADRDRLLDEVDDDLAVSGRAIPFLPGTSRRAVHAAHRLFTELSGQLRRTPAQQICHDRVRVPVRVKARVIANAWMTSAA